MIKFEADYESNCNVKVEFSGNSAVLLGELSYAILNILVRMSNETGIEVGKYMDTLTEQANNEVNISNMKNIISNEERKEQ